MPEFGLPRESRLYRCTVCGHQKKITTNHTDSCADYCNDCSWKPSAGPSYSIPALGSQTYRLFVYVQPEAIECKEHHA